MSKANYAVALDAMQVQVAPKCEGCGAPLAPPREKWCSKACEGRTRRRRIQADYRKRREAEEVARVSTYSPPQIDGPDVALSGRLGRELAARRPVGPRPTKINFATQEGKRWKGVLLEELIDLRQRDHTFPEIQAALRVPADTLARWLIVARRSDLVVRQVELWKHNPNCEVCGKPLPETEVRRRRYCGDACREKATGAVVAREVQQRRLAEETNARRGRILAIRSEYRRRRATGEHLPWHVLREKPKRLTFQEQASLQALMEEQARDLKTSDVGRRPWIVSLNDHTFDEDSATLLDKLVDSRSYSQAETMMKANGAGGIYRPRIATRPWRIRR